MEDTLREKGNSVLAMIEETGLIGLILFLLPMIWIIRKFIIYNSQFTIKENFRSNSTFYTAAGRRVVIVHYSQCSFTLNSKRWWVGVGSVTLPLYLIVLFLYLRNTMD